MNAFVLENFFSPDECAAVPSLAPSPGLIAEGEIRALRRSRIAFYRDAKVETKIAGAMRYANEKMFRFDLMALQPLQWTEYKVGDYYDDHLDIGPGIARTRKLSASLFLTAPSEYDGGELRLWNTPSVGRAQGTLIVFPSYLVHRVTPVTGGVRRSLVAWYAGLDSYR